MLPVKTDPAVGVKDDLADFLRIEIQSKGIGETNILAGNIIDNGAVSGEKQPMAVCLQIIFDFGLIFFGKEVSFGPETNFRIFAVVWFGNFSQR